jgi:hypothetical protein
MEILKFGALAALGATLAGPAMAYPSSPQMGLTGGGEPGHLAFNAPSPSGNSAGTVWTWPVLRGQSGSGTAMNTGQGGTTWTWPVPLRESGSKITMNTAPGTPAPRAVE